MRRWIFAALVLANLGLLIWGVFYLETERTEMPEPAPPIAPEKMRLLDRRESERARMPPRNVGAELKLVSAPMYDDTIKPSVCYRLGPMSEAAQVMRVEEGLKELSLLYTRREDAIRLVTGYRVYLPPFPSRQDAERKRRELTKLGFKDHALLQEEGLPHALSLGLFSVEENAQGRIKALAEKGIQAKMRMIEQARTVYWLDFGQAGVAPDAHTRVKGLLEAIPGASMHELPCSSSVPGQSSQSR